MMSAIIASKREELGACKSSRDSFSAVFAGLDTGPIGVGRVKRSNAKLTLHPRLFLIEVGYLDHLLSDLVTRRRWLASQMIGGFVPQPNYDFRDTTIPVSFSRTFVVWTILHED